MGDAHAGKRLRCIVRFGYVSIVFTLQARTFMSDTPPDSQFWKIADAFIGVANEQIETLPWTKVSAAMVFAASRFSAFVLAASAGSAVELTAKREEAIAYVLSQFEQMLRDNMADYEENFSKYLPPAVPPGN